MKQLTKIAIGLGSNLGDRVQILRQAASLLSEEFLVDAVSSRVYESPPWGNIEQPHFLNAVLVGESEWKPPAIVAYLKQLEAQLGRQPGPRFGPRLIDLDLLMYGASSWKSEGVEVPHPRMADRDFVLLPLLEVWPSDSAKLMWSKYLENHKPTATVISPPLLGTASL